MGLCPSCRGAKNLPLMGGMGTKECGTCKGKGCVEGMIPTAFFPGIESPIIDEIAALTCEKPPLEIPEIKLLQDEPITAEQIIERTEEAKPKSKKMGRSPKTKSRWGL